MSRLFRGRIAVLFTAFIAWDAVSDDGLGLLESIAAGDATVQFRLRHEYVDQDAFAEQANATTLRLRLNFASKPWQGWASVLEFDHVAELLADDFNSAGGTSSPARAQFPVVPDPDGTDLNQAYIQYSPSTSWKTRIGRQRIVLDDQRFVGGVGWRQNEQTYDGVTLGYSGQRLKAFYGFIHNVNRIFGDSSAAGDHEQKTHLLKVDLNSNKAWNATAYMYVIDNDDVPAFSSGTTGLRINGKYSVGAGQLSLLADAATQSDTGNAPVDFNADYFRIQARWGINDVSVGLGIESLGTDNGKGFATPLATLHAFNGWADKFLGTPANGLLDHYLQFDAALAHWKFKCIYHDFSAESGGEALGSEIDISASRPVWKRYKLLLKAAAFNADSPAYDDTTKLWIMYSGSF